jgi:ABC-2 type transport system permease protein
MSPLAIAGVNLRRTLRDRTNLFFVVLFPLLMVAVLGLAFGGSFTPRVALVVERPGTLSGALADRLESTPGIDVERVDRRADAIGQVENGRMAAAVVIPAGYDGIVARGGQAPVEYVSQGDKSSQQIGMVVRGAVSAESSRIRVARVLEDRLGGDLPANLQRVDQTSAALADVTVATRTTGTAMFPTDLGRFDLGASSMLLLFIFVTSMTAATALIETRRLGVSRRMLSTPTRVSGIVAGEALGRVAVAVVQGVVIMVGSALVFHVPWGNAFGAAAVMVVFATVAGAAGLLLGSVSRTEQQAIGAGLLLGLGLGALGGTMMPLDLFSPTMLAVAHLTPHAWAGDAFATLVRHDGGVLDILGELGVLMAYAAVLFVLGAWALRRRILRGD